MSGLIASMERTVIDVLGDRDTARAVVSELLRRHGGDRLYLPSCHYSYRNQQIADMIAGGAAVGRVAKRFGLCERTVRRIIKHSGGGE